MRHRVLVLPMSAAWIAAALPLAASAQPSPGSSGENLTDVQLLGMRLFDQSCRVCHTKPQMTSPQYGPALSKNSLNGNEGALRETISNGTPRMPGFKYHFEPAQIDAIVAYIKTLPAASAAPAKPAKAGGSRDAD